MAGPNIDMRMAQGHHLTLTPRLQQSLRLLRYTAIELKAVISQALSENPMLECADEAAEESPLGYGEREAASDDGGVSGTESDFDSESNSESIVESSDGFTEGFTDKSGAPRDPDEDPGQSEPARQQSLRDFLLEQLSLTRASPRDRALTALLIDAVDENGYLESTLQDVLSWLPDGCDVTLDELRVAQRLLQSFDPAGVGARDLAECLVLQLDRMTATDPNLARALACARALCAKHLPLLASGNIVKLREALQCDDQTLDAAYALTLSLEPHPGHAWTVPAAQAAVPDVIARKARGGKWQVALNPAVAPRLSINAVYAQVLDAHRDAGHAAMQEQLQQARWLLRNVRQRFDTILRVAQAIVDRQQAFFIEGQTAMQPLVLSDIAQALAMHESTVSRATVGKYILTPYGTVELKHFFSAGLATQEGEAVSAKAIQAHIQRLVNDEPANQPLSDEQISRKLAEQGILVARRTVAKYRDILRIAPMTVRRAHAQAQARMR